MPAVHNIGRLFTHRFSYPSAEFPLLDRGNTQEVTWPFRVSRPLVVRIPLTRHGFVLGWWGSELPEEIAVERAVSGALIGYSPTRNYDGESDVEEEEEEPARNSRRRCTTCGTPWVDGPDGFCPECGDVDE
jgi:hypothetical protein